MKALLNGDTTPVQLAKGADEVVTTILMNDDGSVLDLTGGTVDLVVYDRSDRSNAAIATHGTDTLVAAGSGHATVAIPDTELTYKTGTYYMFAKHVDSTAKVFWAEPYTLIVR